VDTSHLCGISYKVYHAVDKKEHEWSSPPACGRQAPLPPRRGRARVIRKEKVLYGF